MAHRIIGVEPGSIAEQLGIAAGDELLKINGERVIDFIDYQALCCREEIDVELRRGGERIEHSFEKDEYEELGLRFETPMMSGIRDCCNECVFCFVDQLPRTARGSMRVKDDDWRTSLLMGSFVTLTNVGERELARIIRRQASPLYISVHAADDELRCKLLGTARGAGIMDALRKLADGGIQFHAQAVICPGLNDGAAMEQTIEDLSGLHPACQSLALVPVGLTGHRDGLPELKPFDAEAARDVLTAADSHRERLLKRIGSRFVHAADELYILAGRQFPSDVAYEGYPQIDNGVGLCRQLQTEFEWALEDADLGQAKPGSYAIACGVAAQPFLRELLERHPIPGVAVSVHPVVNRHFGESVSVSGLIVGRDLIEQMRGVRADRILITECMLRDGERVFLDDVTLEQAQSELGVPILPVGRTGEALLDILMGFQRD